MSALTALTRLRNEASQSALRQAATQVQLHDCLSFGYDTAGTSSFAPSLQVHGFTVLFACTPPQISPAADLARCRTHLRFRSMSRAHKSLASAGRRNAADAFVTPFVASPPFLPIAPAPRHRAALTRPSHARRWLRAHTFTHTCARTDRLLSRAHAPVHLFAVSATHPTLPPHSPTECTAGSARQARPRLRMDACV